MGGRCVEINHVYVEASQFVFHASARMKSSCMWAILSSNYDSVGCGSLNMRGDVTHIRYPHNSGSSPDFSTSSRVSIVPFALTCVINTRQMSKVRPYVTIDNELYFAYEDSSINVCTKLYGTGGVISNERYAIRWLDATLSFATTVTIYQFDRRLAPQTQSLLDSYRPRVALVPWNMRTFDNETRHKQTENAHSDIEISYRFALDHCSKQSMETHGWILVIDLDEMIQLRSKTTLFDIMSRASSLSFAQLDLFDPHTPCPYSWKVAHNASLDVEQRHKLNERSDFFRNGLGWKGMIAPRHRTFYLGAHIRGGVLVSPTVAYVTHKPTIFGCDQMCCCRSSRCE